MEHPTTPRVASVGAGSHRNTRSCSKEHGQAGRLRKDYHPASAALCGLHRLSCVSLIGTAQLSQCQTLLPQAPLQPLPGGRPLLARLLQRTAKGGGNAPGRGTDKAAAASASATAAAGAAAADVVAAAAAAADVVAAAAAAADVVVADAVAPDAAAVVAAAAAAAAAVVAAVATAFAVYSAAAAAAAAAAAVAGGDVVQIVPVLVPAAADAGD
eukprot:1181321-Prorocentrum_minimum.AAC.2